MKARYVAAVAALSVWPWVHAQDDARESALASAVDNYNVAWHAEVEDIKGNTRLGGWERTLDEAMDGTDSVRILRSKLKEQEIARLVTQVTGPATVSWWWRAKPGTFDALVFSAEGGLRVPWQSRGVGERDDGWASVEVQVGEGEQRVTWEYVRGLDAADENLDAADEKQSSGVAFIDRIAIGSAADEAIEPTTRVDRDNRDQTVLEWDSLAGRVYQIMMRKPGDELWTRTRKTVTATSHKTSFPVPTMHAEQFNYNVVMLQPPSLTQVPDREQRVALGQELRLRYEAEGSGNIKWRWTIEREGGEKPDELATSGPELRIERADTRDEGTYRAVAQNDAGREEAPPVTVVVGLAPDIRLEQWREGRDSMIGYINAENEGPQTIHINHGISFAAVGIVKGTPPLREARWERYDPETDTWTPVADTGCGQTNSPCENARVTLEGTAEEEPLRYRLWARNDFGANSGADLTLREEVVADLPFIADGQDIPDDDRIYYGDQTVLEFEPDAEDDVEVRWLRDNAPIHDGRSTRVQLAPMIGAWCERDSDAEPRRSYFQAQLWRNNEQVGPSSHRVGVWNRMPKPQLLNLGTDPETGREVSMTLVPVPGGQFTLGSNGSREGNEGPQRIAILPHTYWIGASEVSGRQWRAVMRTTRAKSDALPAGVSYHEALRFIEQLGKQQAERDVFVERTKFALPTEAQWERAARLAWQMDPRSRAPAPVPGVEQPLVELKGVTEGVASCGLHGMFDNAWEWTRNWYRRSAHDEKTANPSGPKYGVLRTLRGGGVGLKPYAASPTVRIGVDPAYGRPNYGFRIVLERMQPPGYRLGEIAQSEKEESLR